MVVSTSFLVKRNLANWVYAAIITILFFACHTSKPATSNCKEISDYLSFAVELDTSSVALGDSVMMQLKFTNTSSDTVEFYPKAMYLLKVLPEHFHTPRKSLRETLNFGESAKLLPGEDYIFTQYLQADSSLFFRQINTFALVYIADPFPSDYAIYNMLCGTIQAPEVILEVIK
jgi:hypothetical protein